MNTTRLIVAHLHLLKFTSLWFSLQVLIKWNLSKLEFWHPKGILGKKTLINQYIAIYGRVGGISVYASTSDNIVFVRRGSFHQRVLLARVFFYQSSSYQRFFDQRIFWPEVPFSRGSLWSEVPFLDQSYFSPEVHNALYLTKGYVFHSGLG